MKTKCPKKYYVSACQRLNIRRKNRRRRHVLTFLSKTSFICIPGVLS